MYKFTRNHALAVSAIALIFGAIGPWVSVLGFISGGPTNSLEIGLVVFGGIGLVILSAITGRFMRLVSIVVGLLILAEASSVFYNIRDLNESDWVAPGWGLYLTILAALFLVGSTWIAKPKPAVEVELVEV